MSAFILSSFIFFKNPAAKRWQIFASSEDWTPLVPFSNIVYERICLAYES
jgi:hypothetical protein